jgi:hypothetical protein
MTPDTDGVERLVRSVEPSVRLKAADLLDDSHDLGLATELREQVRTSPRVATLLSGRDETGRTPGPPVHLEVVQRPLGAGSPCGARVPAG